MTSRRYDAQPADVSLAVFGLDVEGRVPWTTSASTSSPADIVRARDAEAEFLFTMPAGLREVQGRENRRTLACRASNLARLLANAHA
jgi:hypothetical protein